jgi:hypothetical protein
LEEKAVPETYHLCPECVGTSANMIDIGYADANLLAPIQEYTNDECPRCGRNGTLPESAMTPEEIEADRRFLEEDAEARNRVDFS